MKREIGSKHGAGQRLQIEMTSRTSDVSGSNMTRWARNDVINSQRYPTERLAWLYDHDRGYTTTDRTATHRLTVAKYVTGTNPAGPVPSFHVVETSLKLSDQRSRHYLITKNDKL